MGAGGSQDHRPTGPRVVVRTGFGGFRQQLKLVDNLGALPMGGAQAVGARVAPSQNDDPLALGRDLAFYGLPGQYPVLLGQILHGEVHAIQFPPGNVQISRLGGTAGQAHRVVFFQELLSGIVDAHVYPNAELNALGFHQLNPGVAPRTSPA